MYVGTPKLVCSLGYGCAQPFRSAAVLPAQRGVAWRVRSADIIGRGVSVAALRTIIDRLAVAISGTVVVSHDPSEGWCRCRHRKYSGHRHSDRRSLENIDHLVELHSLHKFEGLRPFRTPASMSCKGKRLGLSCCDQTDFAPIFQAKSAPAPRHFFLG